VLSFISHRLARQLPRDLSSRVDFGHAARDRQLAIRLDLAAAPPLSLPGAENEVPNVGASNRAIDPALGSRAINRRDFSRRFSP
jgi:hypothetical protein